MVASLRMVNDIFSSELSENDHKYCIHFSWPFHVSTHSLSNMTVDNKRFFFRQYLRDCNQCVTAVFSLANIAGVCVCGWGAIQLSIVAAWSKRPSIWSISLCSTDQAIMSVLQIYILASRTINHWFIIVYHFVPVKFYIPSNASHDYEYIWNIYSFSSPIMPS